LLPRFCPLDALSLDSNRPRGTNAVDRQKNSYNIRS
jgi:hypothetical protein